ncbi:hypothetical protein VP01_13905g1, partial [Puccinia sorghi]
LIIGKCLTMHPLEQSAALEIQPEAYDLRHAQEAHQIISIPEEPDRPMSHSACPATRKVLMINGPQVSSELNGDLESGSVAHDSPQEWNADTSRQSLPSPREVGVEISPQSCRILEEPTGPHPEGSKSQNSCAICLEDFEPAEKED